MRHRLIFIFLFSLVTSIAPLYSQKNCEYSHDPTTTELTWTAYKFTEKIGVSGSFKNVTATPQKTSATLVSMYDKLNFTIDSSSVDSKNPDRDNKISTYFFGNVPGAQPSLIKGSFLSVQKKDSGKAQLKLEINSKTKVIPVSFSWSGDTITATASLNIVDFQLSKGLQALNEVCTELHKGADGISKLWPNVDIKITSTPTKRCKP